MEGWQVEWFCLTNEFWTGRYWDDFSVDGFSDVKRKDVANEVDDGTNDFNGFDLIFDDGIDNGSGNSGGTNIVEEGGCFIESGGKSEGWSVNSVAGW